MAARTSLIVLIVAAYIGGAVALHVCWQHSFLLALLAAPFGGSLAAISAALLLYLRDPNARNRPSGPEQRISSELLARIS
ncbi:hypothetical protein FV242_26455 [Methylobacterium sp. WL64]|nr:hypothetical protein FV242_26455 [Methylobacterium sp. WL64]